TEQATDTQLNYWNIFTDTAGVNVTLCNFALSAGTGDTTAPTVAMTAPTCGNNCQGTITVSANASDNVGVAGVQFLLDNAPYGSEDTSSPYSIPANTTVIANGPHTFSARARDAAGNTTTAAPVSITITNATTPGSHPRIWLDNTRLSQLKGKAGANDPAWLNLKNKCNSYLGTNATVWAPPTGTDGCHVYCGGAANSSCAAAANQDSACNPPNVCCGYEGSWFYDALLEEALCYRIGLATGDPNTAAWGAKGVDILTNMIIFVNYGGDDGFGIKFFATAEAIGYDWLYPLLSSNQRTSVVNNLNGWIDWFDAHGVGRNSPTSNYFAGYYAAKAYVAIATEGDNANASSYWSDFLNRLQKGGPGAIGPDGNGNSHAGIANYYTNYLDGGGYPQGWEYANVAVRNMTEPMLAALTGKGLDLINDSTAPYHYPINLPEHLMQVTWPSLLYVDDRDDIHSAQTCPGGSVPTADVVSSMYAMLKRWKPAYAPIFHSWAKAVRNNAPAPAPWLDFLFWDENDPSTDYTNTANEPASYLSRAAAPSGTNYAAMRSSWASTATFGSLRAMPYMNDTDNAHEFMDAGALAITRGDTPFLVNPSFMDRCYGTGSQTFYDNYIEDQTVNSTTAPRQFFNIFYTGTSSGQLYYTDEVDRVSPAAATTGITRFEDKNGYVYTQADKLEQMYPSTANITSWTRDVVYLRPSIFVVYDRTVTNGAPVDARMSWNFPPVPTLGTPPSSGAVRYDVNDSVSGFKGSITTVLPASAQVGLSNSSGIDGSGKMYGLDVRPASAASSLQWLTILDASSSSSAVALASIPTGITSNVKGTLLKTSSTNYVVLFGAGAANSAITVTSTQPVSFQEPTGIATKIVVTDMPINTSYSVTLQTSGSNYIVTITPGTGFTTTEYGTLYLSVSSTGTVTNGT
ncbi:MAG: hypothetical protein JO257_16255, partial [Deltaproteobacteria bacterium]|nr:hypothetical protein [Deltaproteobacteria bacterium]